MDTNTLSLKPGTRLRTGGVSYEVTEDASVSAGVVPVVPQSTRLLKVYCETCGYTARITKRWIDKAGTPDCPAGHGNMVVAPVKEREAAKPAPAAPKIPAPAKVAQPKVKPAPVAEPEPDYIADYLAAEEAREVFEALEQEPESPSTLAQLLADV
jgi:hypothetical protein